MLRLNLSNTTREFWVVEHPSRGVFMGWRDLDWDPKTKTYHRKPRFSWSKLRSQGQKFYTEKEATELVKKLKQMLNTNKVYAIHFAKELRNG